MTRWITACCRLPSQVHLTARHIPFLPLETKADQTVPVSVSASSLPCFALRVCAAELGWIGLDRTERPSRQVRLPPDLCVPRLSFASRSLLGHLITPPSRDQTDGAARLHNLRAYSVSSPPLRATRHHLQGHQPNRHLPPPLPNSSRGQGATNHGLNRTLHSPAYLRLTPSTRPASVLLNHVTGHGRASCRRPAPAAFFHREAAHIVRPGHGRLRR